MNNLGCLKAFERDEVLMNMGVIKRREPRARPFARPLNPKIWTEHSNKGSDS
jgi:hypothetical protein